MSTFGRFKYVVDHGFFNAIDTEEKAYWLGFIAADGCIKRNTSTLEVTLKRADEEHLYELKRVLKTDAPIRHGAVHGYPTARFVITSPQIATDLARYNVVPGKSLTYDFPEKLPRQYFWAFLRGYFDGDGSICLRRTHNRIWSLKGTQGFLTFVMDYFSEELGIKPSQFRQVGKKTFELQYSGRPALKLLYNVFYCSGGYALARKRFKWLEVIKEINYRTPCTVLPLEVAKKAYELHQQGMPMVKLAKIFNCSDTGIAKAFRRNGWRILTARPRRKQKEKGWQ